MAENAPFSNEEAQNLLSLEEKESAKHLQSAPTTNFRHEPPRQPSYKQDQPPTASPA
jgi:hypothetical protein